MFLFTSILLLAASAQSFAQTCESFGIDIKQGGTYFENATSAEQFSFVSVFEGCQNDTANNLLVDPSGKEIMCSDTMLLPSDVNMLSTCPILKNQLVSGDWSILIISNNGNGTPIAYERDFTLIVGTPVTSTYTPTMTITATTQAVVNTTVTTCETDIETETVTATPKPLWQLPTLAIPIIPITTTTKTVTLGMVRRTSNVVESTVNTATSTATCSVPPRQAQVDPLCSITPTLVYAAAMHTDQAQLNVRAVYDGLSDGSHKVGPRRRSIDRAVPVDRLERLRQRRTRLAIRDAQLEKRTPDSATVTVTATDPTIVTDCVTSGTTTMTVTGVRTETSTITTTEAAKLPRPLFPIVTVDLPTLTITRHRFTIVTSTVATATHSPSTEITSTSTPSASAAECKSSGGAMQ